LTRSEIEAAMRGEAVQRPAAEGARTLSKEEYAALLREDASCALMSEPQDARLPGAAALLGALAGAACAGLWPGAGSFAILMVSFAAGLLLQAAAPSMLPLFSLCMMSLASIAGGASVAASVRRDDPDDPRVKAVVGSS
jgi:hypothetical protein